MQPLSFLSVYCDPSELLHLPRIASAKKKKKEEGRLLCDTLLPRIPERRLSLLPLNIHPLGKPDKNKARALSSIVPPPPS